MDLKFINYFMKLIQKALEWLQEMWKEAGRTGFPPFSFMPEKEAIDWTTAHREPPEEWDDKRIRLEYRRMLTRNRVRRWRKRQKEGDASTVHTTVTACEKNGVTAGACVTENNAPVTEGNGVTAYGNGNSVTGNAKNVTCNASVTECNAAVTGGNDSVTDHTEPATPGCAAVAVVNAVATECNAAVTEGNDSVTPGNASAKKEKENEKRKKQRKELKKNKKTKTNIADAMPTSAREGIATSVTEMEKCNDGNVMAAATQKNETGDENNTATPQPQQKNAELIPTEKLPEAFRKVVMAWNQLPLEIKLSGLYPRLVKRLRNLFENYGEEQVHKAIESIANSPFLLGKSKNNRGWVVSFSWLTDPENLEKILEGQYLDKAANNWGARLFQQGDELLPLPEGFIGTVVY
ncbi:MAG: hypothetical protein IJ181_07935 [Acidaminococcaceae bacterium]|nr:hypothetical protein [Acidaminococcaceae bacterium]